MRRLRCSLPFVLAGCGGSQNALNPHSHPAADIANLFWVMTAVAFGGLALITGLLVFAWIRRGRRGFGGLTPTTRIRERSPRGSSSWAAASSSRCSW